MRSKPGCLASRLYSRAEWGESSWKDDCHAKGAHGLISDAGK